MRFASRSFIFEHAYSLIQESQRLSVCLLIASLGFATGTRLHLH